MSVRLAGYEMAEGRGADIALVKKIGRYDMADGANGYARNEDVKKKRRSIFCLD